MATDANPADEQVVLLGVARLAEAAANGTAPHLPQIPTPGPRNSRGVGV